MLCTQVEQLVPQLLPDVAEEAISLDRIMGAITEWDLPMEREGGWLQQQLQQRQRGTGSIRDDIRRFEKFIDFLELSQDRFELDEFQHKFSVSYCFIPINIIFNLIFILCNSMAL